MSGSGREEIRIGCAMLLHHHEEVFAHVQDQRGLTGWQTSGAFLILTRALLTIR